MSLPDALGAYIGAGVDRRPDSGKQGIEMLQNEGLHEGLDPGILFLSVRRVEIHAGGALSMLNTQIAAEEMKTESLRKHAILDIPKPLSNSGGVVHMCMDAMWQ